MLEVKNVSFGYGKKSLNLNDISFACAPGDCVAILGNNGCGKTTLIKVLDRILTPRTGEVLLGGIDLAKISRTELSQKIAYVAQENQPVRATVFDSILLGRKPHIRIRATDHDYEVTESVIKRLRLEEHALRYADELSGGEYQKVVLGRALAQEPCVLLLDEPTSNLDMRNQKEVLELVKEIVQETGIIALVVIHDINSALRYCNRFVFLKDHEIYAAGGSETATDETISNVYGLPVHVHTIQNRQIVISE